MRTVQLSNRMRSAPAYCGAGKLAVMSVGGGTEASTSVEAGSGVGSGPSRAEQGSWFPTLSAKYAERMGHPPLWEVEGGASDCSGLELQSRKEFLSQVSWSSLLGTSGTLLPGESQGRMGHQVNR